MPELNLNLHPFPTLETERLALREITHADDEDMFQLRSNRGLMQYIDRPLAKSMEEIHTLVQRIIDVHKNNEGISWGISLKDNPKLIGTIGFWRIQKEHYRGEIGYMLHADYHRKGIMYEAMQATVEFAFRHINLHSIEANINPNNLPSIKLAEKQGFVREAYFKQNYFYNGKFLDTYIYSMLNPYDRD